MYAIEIMNIQKKNKGFIHKEAEFAFAQQLGQLHDRTLPTKGIKLNIGGNDSYVNGTQGRFLGVFCIVLRKIHCYRSAM